MLTHCTYGTHSQRITSAAIQEGYSRTSPPQTYCKHPADQRNAITGGARNQRVPLARI
ncbi:MAG: hypothetical protein IJ900_01795 [Paludibacteraceae bacterium]|nr:hypothetical protein [Paludibacteraceae bacterium]